MSNKQFAITSFSLCFGLFCLIYLILFMTIAEDLGQKVDYLEERIRVCEGE